MIDVTMDRREVLERAGAGILCAGVALSAEPVTARDDPSPPEDDEAVLGAMDGDGSADDPYVVTDVVELQALAGAPDAHAVLGRDVDASATADWHETTTIESDWLGVPGQDPFDLSYGPIESGSETVYTEVNGGTERRRLAAHEYTVDDVAGTVVLTESRDEYHDLVWAEYDLRDPVRKGFEPIGRGRTPFTGTFDGRGHEIRDLVVNRPHEQAGLFGTATGGDDGRGAIVNLRLTGANVHGGGGDASGPYDVGGLLGTNDGGLVTDVTVSGRVESSELPGRWSPVGGVVGRQAAGELRHARSDAAVYGDSRVGGLVGGNRHKGLVDGCRATGDVTSSHVAGGLAGKNVGVVRRCRAEGTVEGEWPVGGLVGDVSGTVRESSATGAVSGEGSVGGLVGDCNLYEGEMVACYATGRVTAERRAGALVGRLFQGPVIDCWAAGAVDADVAVGGLVGLVTEDAHEDADRPPIQDAYWDRQATGRDVHVGGHELDDAPTVTENVSARATAEMQGESAAEAMAALDFGTTWRPVTDPADYPELRADVDAGVGPRAELVPDPETPAPGRTVTLDASESGPGRLRTYEWDLPDGDATGRTVDLAVDDPGEYEVSLLVVDDAGNAASTTRTLVVEPTPDPTPTADGSDSGESGTAETDPRAPDDDGPGFTVGLTLANLGGLAYALRRRIE